MVCKNPFQQGVRLFDCGNCIPCRIKRRRTWTHRILLEASQSVDNAFITLTYSDETLPSSLSLMPEHLQLWLKKFRKAISPARVRFYAVGEYGEQTQRPHYHVILFGYPNCRRGQSRFGLMPRLVNKEHRCCDRCDLIADTWALGGIFVGALEMKSAQYVAGYVMKKMTHMQDERLNGRWPEFARMSRRPGLGVGAMHDVADVLMRFNLDTSQPDVPSVLAHGRKQLPLGRHLRTKLREMIGKEENAPPEVLRQINQEMLILQQGSIDAKEAKSIKQIVKERDLGKVQQIEVRQQIHSSKRKI